MPRRLRCLRRVCEFFLIFFGHLSGLRGSGESVYYLGWV